MAEKIVLKDHLPRAGFTTFKPRKRKNEGTYSLFTPRSKKVKRNIIFTLRKLNTFKVPSRTTEFMKYFSHDSFLNNKPFKALHEAGWAKLCYDKFGSPFLVITEKGQEISKYDTGGSKDYKIYFKGVLIETKKTYNRKHTF